MEHEMPDDQLTPATEQIEQGRLSLWALEEVFLLDPHHRQPASLGIERVPLPGEFLFLGQECLAGGEPLRPRYDVW